MAAKRSFILEGLRAQRRESLSSPPLKLKARLALEPSTGQRLAHLSNPKENGQGHCKRCHCQVARAARSLLGCLPQWD